MFYNAIKKAFLIVGIVKERIFRVGPKTGSVIFTSRRRSASGSITLMKMGSESRFKKKIVSDPQHCFLQPVPVHNYLVRYDRFAAGNRLIKLAHLILQSDWS
jgi:hypothetical protein